MIETSRRGFLGASAALPTAVAISHSRMVDDARIAADLERYVGFGIKRAGGVGDTACGNWLASALQAAGYKIERQQISVPYFESHTAELVCEGLEASVHPQPIVVPTGPNGVSGPLVRVDGQGRWEGAMEGAIALIDLPFARWSSLFTKSAHEPIRKAVAARAAAVVAITNGPTGKLIALNTDGRNPMFGCPLALIAPDDAGQFLAFAMARRNARLRIEGKGGRRPAFNFVGRLERGRGRWLVVSTPRSGWFACAGERGPGVAVWLDLARRAAQHFTNHNLAFICNTGHEYEYLGAAEAMRQIAPPAQETDFWLHLGANVAARDWHTLGGHISPLPSADSQRYLSISPDLLALAAKIFAGQPGLEAPISSGKMSAGELDEVIKAGYAPAAGVFGIHRFHHVAEDDIRCLNSSATVEAADSFFSFLIKMSALTA